MKSSEPPTATGGRQRELSLRDPVHGFIRADRLEAALIDSAPFRRLRFIRQLGLAYLVFPGAEHSRFGHALGTMHLAGRLYDALAARPPGLLDPHPRAPERRLVRLAALLHDLGHAPFSHTAEELFDEPIDHEEMTRRLFSLPELERLFQLYGDGVGTTDVIRLLAGGGTAVERLLSQIVSSELDVDKMDYLLRDSLFCGVHYGTFDLDRLLDTVLPLADAETGELGIGVEEGGVHALEALVLARYYMFTQVYFNVTCKALELHLSTWLEESGVRWPTDPLRFLARDDVTVFAEMRQADSAHARAVVARQYFPLAFETREHLTPDEKQRFETLIPQLREQFGSGTLLISNSAKDPHRLAKSRVLVQRWDGRLEPMERASHFIRHLGRIERYRVYAAPACRDRVASALAKRWP